MRLRNFYRCLRNSSRIIFRSVWGIALSLFWMAIVCSSCGKKQTTVTVTETRPNRAATHFRAVSFAPGTSSVWIAGFNGVILRSLNGGENWEFHSTGVTSRFYDIQALDQNTIVACGSAGTVLISSDGGCRWTQTKKPTMKRLVGIHFVDPDTGWVAGDDGEIFHTADGGKSWVMQSSNLQTGLRQIWFKNSSLGFVVGYHGWILKTEDGGDNWISADAPAEFTCYGADFGRNGEEIHIAGSFGMILHSPDRGNTWNYMNSETRSFLRDVKMLSNNRGIAVGYGCIMSYDSKQESWKLAKNISGYHLQSVDFSSQDLGIAVGRWGIVYVTKDGGRSWTADYRLFSPDLKSIATKNGKIIVAGGADGHLMRSVDAGKTWNYMWVGRQVNINAVHLISPSKIIAVGMTGLASVSKNEGHNWVSFNLPCVDYNDVSFRDEDNGFIVGDMGTIFRTSDGGRSWHDYSLNRKEDIYQIEFKDQKHGWMIGENGLILESIDGGDSWIGQYTGVTKDLKSGWFGAEGSAWVASEDAWVLASESSGTNSSWEKRSVDCPITAMDGFMNIFADHCGNIVFDPFGNRHEISFGTDTIFALSDPMEENGKTFLFGAGDFGRIIRVIAEND